MRLVHHPFEIHPRPAVCEGVFARIDDYLELERDRLSELPAGEYRDLLERFFTWAADTIDADAYEALQVRHITNPKGPVKFLNLPYYVKNKMSHIQKLGLHNSPPKTILDIGCGPGHMHLLGRFFGHEVFGLDVPMASTHIYSELCRFFHAEKIEHLIEPMQWLPALPRRYDLVTIILLNLGPWEKREWRFFINDLMGNVIADDGALYLTFTQRRWTESGWNYLSSISEFTSKDSRAALIRKS